MTKREFKIIRKWAKLRTPDTNWKKFAMVAESLYNSLNERDKQLMLTEFDGYILKVQSGILKPEPVALPKIPKLL